MQLHLLIGSLTDSMFTDAASLSSGQPAPLDSTRLNTPSIVVIAVDMQHLLAFDAQHAVGMSARPSDSLR